MSRYAAPSSSYTSRFSAGIANAGLASSVRFRLIDSDSAADDPVYGPSSTGVVEDPTGSGDYMVTITLPSVSGTYFPAWDLGSGQLFYDEPVVVTRTGAVTVGAAELYVTVDELTDLLNLSGADGLYDQRLANAAQTACRAVDAYCGGTRFYPTEDVTRKFTGVLGDLELRIGEWASIDQIMVDENRDGYAETEWTLDTHVLVSPPNATQSGFPITSLVIPEWSSKRFPHWTNAVHVTGTYGWAETPPVVRQAAEILATRLFKRADTPYGILTAGTETVMAARIGRIDPDVATLLDNIPGRDRPGRMRSVRLG